MTDFSPPKAPETPPVPSPGAQLPLPMPPREEPKSGCLKWGLLGCAGASILVIVGLVFLMTNAKNMMEWAFDKMSDQTLAACTPDVTPDEKNAFRSAIKEFSDKAKDGKVKPGQVRTFQSKELSVLGDGKVTPEELRGLTAWLAAETR